MNREIKFRAWYNSKYHYNIEKHHLEHHSMSVFMGEVWDFSDWLENAIIQQYTGLKDKNDKEIYEGDILERIGNGSFCKIMIFWDDQNCRFISKNSFNLHGEGSSISNNIINISDWTYWVVCGNIMENPELIQ